MWCEIATQLESGPKSQEMQNAVCHLFAMGYCSRVVIFYVILQVVEQHSLASLLHRYLLVRARLWKKCSLMPGYTKF